MSKPHEIITTYFDHDPLPHHGLQHVLWSDEFEPAIFDYTHHPDFDFNNPDNIQTVVLKYILDIYNNVKAFFTQTDMEWSIQFNDRDYSCHVVFHQIEKQAVAFVLAEIMVNMSMKYRDLKFRAMRATEYPDAYYWNNTSLQTTLTTDRSWYPGYNSRWTRFVDLRGQPTIAGVDNGATYAKQQEDE